jgi:hypothetical protein
MTDAEGEPPAPEGGSSLPESGTTPPTGEPPTQESEPSLPEGGPAPTMGVKYYGQVKDRLRWLGLYLWIAAVFGGLVAVSIGQFGTEDWARAGQYSLLFFGVLFVVGVVLFVSRRNTRVFCGNCKNEVTRNAVQCPSCGVILYDFLNQPKQP